MNTAFYPEGFNDPITGDSKILIVKPSKDYDATEALKKLVLDKREVCFTYPKEGIDIWKEALASGCKICLQVGTPVTRKLPVFTGEVSPELEKRIWEAVEDKFVNYHHHDEYSLRDALGTVGKFDKETKKWTGLAGLLIGQNRKFLSVTNHGSIGGWIKQNNTCKESGLKAIYGMEAYHENFRGDDPDEKKKHRKAYHLILTAKNEEGYFNIIRIHNDAQLNGFYYSPRTCDETLKKYGKGIVATSACAAGFISRLLAEGKEDEAEERYNFYKSCFDEFYIEIQLIEMEEQKELNRKLIRFAQKVGAELTIGIDSHYLYAENQETHDLLMCIRQGKTINDTKEENDDTWQFTVNNLYYRNFEQLYDLFKGGFVVDGKVIAPFDDDVFTEDVFYRACLNTRKIACCADDIKMDSSIKLPKVYEDSEKIFRDMVWEGFRKKGFDKIPESETYKNRLEYELDVICLSGWSDYFLITKMMVDKARELKGEFATGLGRGCFAPWNRVITSKKIPVCISDISVGDSVYSHDGTINKVIDKYEYEVEEELIEIEVDDGRKICCTLDHKILVNRNGKKVWVEAQKLIENDDVVDIF